MLFQLDMSRNIAGDGKMTVWMRAVLASIIVASHHLQRHLWMQQIIVNVGYGFLRCDVVVFGRQIRFGEKFCCRLQIRLHHIKGDRNRSLLCRKILKSFFLLIYPISFA
jgi:hypothetical protein